MSFFSSSSICRPPLASSSGDSFFPPSAWWQLKQRCYGHPSSGSLVQGWTPIQTPPVRGLLGKPRARHMSPTRSCEAQGKPSGTRWQRLVPAKGRRDKTKVNEPERGRTKGQGSNVHRAWVSASRYPGDAASPLSRAWVRYLRTLQNPYHTFPFFFFSSKLFTRAVCPLQPKEIPKLLEIPVLLFPIKYICMSAAFHFSL